MSLDQRLPLLDERSKLVRSDVHLKEIREEAKVRLAQGSTTQCVATKDYKGKGEGTYAVEVGEAALARDLVNTELDLSESLLLVLVEVSERELKDSTLKGVGRVLC